MPRRPLLTAFVVTLLLAATVAGATAKVSGSLAPGSVAAPLGTAFTYQGRLTVSGSPAAGAYDFEFKLYDAAQNGNQIGNTFLAADVPVSNGLFTVQIDFGESFPGEARFLEIGVRAGASTGAYTTLAPRQELTPTPYALHAANAWSLDGNAATDPATNFLGTTDDVALEVRVNNLRALEIAPRNQPLFGDVPTIIGGYAGNVVTDTVVGAVIAGGGAVQDDGVVPEAYNEVNGHFGVVGGGSTNLAGSWAVVDGGQENKATGNFSTVGGGEDNTASGSWAMALGGRFATATGSHSLAAGFGASALHGGAFVWGDASATTGNLKVVESAEANQFLVRANGGAVFLKRTTYPETPNGPIGVEAMRPILANAALQVENHAGGPSGGEAAWLYTADATNGSSVVKLLKAPTGNNFFLECENFAVARKCHIDANGTFVSGSDFAEALPARGNEDEYEPGDVLVLSQEQPGGVEKAAQPYDTRVAGVYSTRPGVLGADKDGDTWVAADDIPVAIVGIVPTKVTAENGPIAVGDLLTTSATEGHAMRAEPVEVAGVMIYPPGTILGKALEPLESGSGVIRVLVTLQ